jgi:hypothetical protein
MSANQDYFSQVEELDEELLSSFPMPQDPNTYPGRQYSQGSPSTATSVSGAREVGTGVIHVY